MPPPKISGLLAGGRISLCFASKIAWFRSFNALFNCSEFVSKEFDFDFKIFFTFFLYFRFNVSICFSNTPPPSLSFDVAVGDPFFMISFSGLSMVVDGVALFKLAVTETIVKSCVKGAL